MKGKIIKKVSLVVVCVSLIFIFSLCSTGGGGQGDIITWVVAWFSNEDLDGNDTEGDIFFSRSTNSGVTWSAVQVLNSIATTDTYGDYDPYVMTDGKGNWVAVWDSSEDLNGAGSTEPDIFTSRSTDDGVTWSAVQVLNSNAATDSGNDYIPKVSTDGNGNWVVVWYSDENLGDTAGTDEDIFVSRSSDNGVTWSAVQTLNSNAISDSGDDFFPNVITDGKGNWIAVWHSDETFGDTIGGDYDIFFSRSTDNGVTWSAVQTLNSNAASDDSGSGDDDSPSVTTDGNGNWVTVWYSFEDLDGAGSGDSDIFVSRSTDNGATWSIVQVLNSNAASDSGDDYNPKVLTDGNGNCVVVWQSGDTLGGTTGTDSDIFFSRSTDNGVTWSAVQALNSNATPDSGADELPSIITDGNGNWVAVWQSRENLGGTAGTDYDIFFSRSTDDGATWSAVQTLNSNATTDTGGDAFID